MRRLIGLAGLTAAALLVTPTLYAQLDLSPPTKSPTAEVANPPAATQDSPRSPTAGTPTTGDTATTLPSAQSTLDSLLKDKPDAIPPVKPSVKNDDGSVTPGSDGSAPSQPKTIRRREGELTWERTGRLAKDNKTQQTIFVFDGDGQDMIDPPVTLLPCRFLALMEDAAASSAQEVKFRITGEFTEYRGKNYLLVQKMETVRALNKGIGGR